MTILVEEYQKAKFNRTLIARKNASLRMAGKSNLVQPLPELPEKPKKYLLETLNGEYLGVEWNEEFANDYASEYGCKLTILPFDAKL